MKRKRSDVLSEKRGSGKHKKKGWREVKRTACLVTALCRWTCQVARWIAATQKTAQEEIQIKAPQRKHSVTSRGLSISHRSDSSRLETSSSMK